MKSNRSGIAVLLFALVLVLALLPSVSAGDGKPVEIVIHRMQHSNDCTSGQILIDNNIVAYSLERPWNGNIPLTSSIPAGRYQAFVRTKTKDRWRIELKNVPGRGNIQLHVGNFIADGVGCILVGASLSKNLCQVVDSARGFDHLKIVLDAAAARLGQKDTETELNVVIEDE